MVLRNRKGPILDLAMGTGDFSVEAARSQDVSVVIGLDLTLPMIILARQKASKNRTLEKIRFVLGDAQSLPFSNERFTCVTVGFGVRNFPDLTEALKELVRVLKPGGRLVILEIVYGRNTGPIATLFRKAFRVIAPWLGAIVAHDREAYAYLPESVLAFLTGDELAQSMECAGLELVERRNFAFATVVILVGKKPR